MATPMAVAERDAGENALLAKLHGVRPQAWPNAVVIALPDAMPKAGAARSPRCPGGAMRARSKPFRASPASSRTLSSGAKFESAARDWSEGRGPSGTGRA